MKSITETLQNLMGSSALKEDEYRDTESGLIFCSRCRTPRQKTVLIGDKIMTPRMMCRCQAEAYEEEKTRRQQAEFLDRVSRLKANGLQDKTLRSYTFANDAGLNPEMEKAHVYVDQFPRMKERGLGLLLWGDVGTGKTFFAGCIANALIEQGTLVLMTNFTRILNSLSGMYSDEKNQFIDSFRHYSLLILDDLGIERNSEYALEQVFHVVDSRCRSGLPMIVTTNLTLQELKHPKDLAHSRIYDRVLENCVPLKINRQNIRKMHAAENMEAARELLTSGTEAF